MAVKDHSLDQRIIDAAKAEFMEHGFRKAGLQKIAARAGITTGALYTRYRSKDDLFCSLISFALEDLPAPLADAQALYRKAKEERSADALLEAIRAEEKVYLDLLFRHYEECVLFFCKSDGSTLEQKMNRLMKEKARQTVIFFRSMTDKEIDSDGIELILSEQFSYYRQMLLRGYDREKVIACMQTVDLFQEAGWKAVFDRIL